MVSAVFVSSAFLFVVPVSLGALVVLPVVNFLVEVVLAVVATVLSIFAVTGLPLFLVTALPFLSIFWAYVLPFLSFLYTTATSVVTLLPFLSVTALPRSLVTVSVSTPYSSPLLSRSLAWAVDLGAVVGSPSSSFLEQATKVNVKIIITQSDKAKAFFIL